MSQRKSILRILPLSEKASKFYKQHGTYHEGDSGLDLFVLENQTIKIGETSFVRLGIKATAYDHENQNVSWLIMPRSSISKTPLRVANSLGLIDAGYRGELICCLDNIKSYDYEIKEGDKLVQAVMFDGKPFDFEIVTELTDTRRGEKGWGSTTTTTTQKDENETPDTTEEPKKRKDQTDQEIECKKAKI